MLTSNITGDGQNYQPPQIRILQALKADIAAMQEFNYAGNSPTEIRSFVDLAFGPDYFYFRESGYQIPNGIVSRFPIAQAGSWPDPVVANRGFAWALIDLPGSNDLYVVSVHLLNSGSASDRNIEAAAIKACVQTNFPPDAWVIVAGDLNTSSRTEAAVGTFKSFLSDSPVPTDSEAGGDPDTNQDRDKPYDYVLPTFSLTNQLVPVAIFSRTFSNGLVFDTRVYTPLSEVPPAQATDSSYCQHMAVVKDFQILITATGSLPQITGQPQSQSVLFGSNVTFTVAATGDPPLAFQWRLYGTNLPGATASIHNLTSAGLGNAGPYSVVVSNAAGSVTSSNATLAVNPGPVILVQPGSVSVLPGQSATFQVQAWGAPPLYYQWWFNGSPISSASLTAYTLTNVGPDDAGNYSVFITNSYGNLTSTAASLTLASTQAQVIAQWNFNNATLEPSIGIATASYVGGTTAASSGEFATGSPTTDPAGSIGNTAWNTSTYPGLTAANKTAGVQFAASTEGWKEIVIRWDQRASDTGSKYARLLYTTNGTVFWEVNPAISLNTGGTFEAKTNHLAGLTGAGDNPDFAFRIVAEFENTATGSGSAGYVAATGGRNYAGSGTVRFDMVTVLGTPLGSVTNWPAPASLTAPLLVNGRLEFNVVGTVGSDYIVQASTNPGSVMWWPRSTNPAPFKFIETNSSFVSPQFYRAVARP